MTLTIAKEQALDSIPVMAGTMYPAVVKEKIGGKEEEDMDECIRDGEEFVLYADCN